MNWWDSTLSWLSKNIPWQTMFGLFAASSALLFFSDPIGIREWAYRYRALEVIVFVFSGTVLLAEAGAALAKWGSALLLRLRARGLCKRRLRSLTVHEKWVLQQYMDEQTRTVYLKMNDGVVAGLIECGVIHLAPVTYARGSTMAYNMSDFAWDYLLNHPELVATPNSPKPKPTGHEWMAD